MKANGLGVDVVEKDNVKIEKYNKELKVKTMKKEEE